ncbi:hypothetical protein ACQQ68_07450 [Corynebacterium diphtheriae]|uniref:hypothetical protein n=1 Tax=Corynebacterium diphtheriae TaxID=1717 RepID=UPI00192B53E1|nr:hypothetical protein [Corynebacterium diphtheriae]
MKQRCGLRICCRNQSTPPIVTGIGCVALLCHFLYPQDARTKAYVPAIFTTLGNYPGLKQLGVTSDAGILDAAFNAYQAEYFTVPGDKTMKFFAPQKKI